MKAFKSVSKIKSTIINEAISVWNKTKNTNTTAGRTTFAKKLKEIGWKRIGTSAAYKTCYAKNSIVVKFTLSVNSVEACNEVEREFQQWNLAPKKFKKYLPRSYALIDGLLIQDKVLVVCDCGWDGCADAKEIKKDFHNHLFDWQHNHGRTLKGTIKFFDWVYNRSWDKVEDPYIDFLK